MSTMGNLAQLQCDTISSYTIKIKCNIGYIWDSLQKGYEFADCYTKILTWFNGYTYAMYPSSPWNVTLSVM